MPCRITINAEQKSLKIDGRLAGAPVKELERAWEAIRGKLVIDLSDLHSAHDAGIRLLKVLRAACPGGYDDRRQAIHRVGSRGNIRRSRSEHRTETIRCNVGRLDEAFDEANARGWTVVSMKHD